jgi:hypothetical protein
LDTCGVLVHIHDVIANVLIAVLFTLGQIVHHLTSLVFMTLLQTASMRRRIENVHGLYVLTGWARDKVIVMPAVVVISHRHFIKVDSNVLAVHFELGVASVAFDSIQLAHASISSE